MRLLYGAPLPPGLVAPTRGELRLRLEQIILDDDVINHNPLVQLFDAADAATADAAATDAGQRASSSRSPNRFVVPVDHCAVGPIFWGETRPSTHGQPSTPQVRRGPAILVYPIKIDAAPFGAYLQRMTASPQRGVQLDVFVPSSYSGRPAVTVGKCRLALDTLRPGNPVHGWFSVLHRRHRLSAEEAGEDKYSEVPVGKLKLSATVEYYPTTRRGETVPQVVQHKRHLDGKEDGSVALPQAKTRRSPRHAGRTGADAPHSPTESASPSNATTSSVESGPKKADASRTGWGGHHARPAPQNVGINSRGESALPLDKNAAAQQLLQQGLRLRARMEAAAQDLEFGEVDPSQADVLVNGKVANLHGPPARVSHLVASPSSSLPAVGDSSAYHSDVDSEKYQTVYTSEDSDEEKFAFQMQKDTEAREQREVQPHASPLRGNAYARVAALQQTSRPEQPLLPLSRSPAGVAISETQTEISGTRGARASVELCFSNFSFARTAATADLQEMRICVRLSSDITTVEPCYGVLSSYVHHVPLQQPFICLEFEVCSFSEDQSKLVVEAYKITTAALIGNEGDNWNAQGPRRLASEELLGLVVVGLFRQSRSVSFHDPIADISNIIAQLEVRLSHSGALTLTGAHPTDSTSPLKHLASAAPSRGIDRPFLSPVKGTSTSLEGVPLTVVRSSERRTTPAAQPTKSDTPSDASQDAPSTLDRTRPSFGHAHARPARGDLLVEGTPVSLYDCGASVRLQRCRLRLLVYSATELPRVALARGGESSTQSTGANDSRFPIVSSSPRTMPCGSVNAVRSYGEPNSFVVVEEIYRREGGSSQDVAALGSPPPSSSSRRCVDGWYVEEARGGYYDRSAVVSCSSNPDYHYEVVVQLPEMTLNTMPEVRTRQHAPAEALEELQLSVWHSDLSHEEVASGASVTSGGSRSGLRGGTARRQEEGFWANAAYMGTCRVDLRPLRYLKSLDGYYRVVCERTPGTAIGPSAKEVETSTIGYLRIGVSLF